MLNFVSLCGIVVGVRYKLLFEEFMVRRRLRFIALKSTSCDFFNSVIVNLFDVVLVR